MPPAVAQLASRQVPGSAVKLVAGKGHLFLAEEPGTCSRRCGRRRGDPNPARSQPDQESPAGTVFALPGVPDRAAAVAP